MRIKFRIWRPAEMFTVFAIILAGAAVILVLFVLRSNTNRLCFEVKRTRVALIANSDALVTALELVRTYDLQRAKTQKQVDQINAFFTSLELPVRRAIAKTRELSCNTD